MDVRISILAIGLLASCSSNSSGTVEESKETTTPISMEDARTLYILHCSSCHGQDGKLGLSNAADLSKSKLSDLQIETTIRHGNDKGMMPYEAILSVGEIKGLIPFVKTLRK